ncbi:MAG: hypothetical protein BGN82_09580 [Alphaproteobacteria bacterium 65-7]|nr:MAG: hypothetical protein BGN82_09580 [Alphaproteobacteria bacterium 65-7]
MKRYLVNLARRPDRLQAMQARAAALGLTLERVEALDAAAAEPAAMDGWFAPSGPLGEIPRGDKACLLSHRRAWEMFLQSGASHAVFLEDDVVLSPAAGALLRDAGWIPAGVPVVKLEHYGPPGQRVLLKDFRALEPNVAPDFEIARMLSRHTGAGAYILSRTAARLLVAQPRFPLPVDHLLFNPNNSPLFAHLPPWQLLPAIARQEQFLEARPEKSDIARSREGLRAFGLTYVRRELVRFGYDLRLLPRQTWALAKGAKFVAMKTEG